MTAVAVDVREQIPHLVVVGKLTEDGRLYLEDVYRAKCEELAALRRLLGYADEKRCTNCGFTRKR